MGALRSALEELGAEDLRFASDEAIEDDVIEIERASRAIDAERLRRIAELDARGSFARDGYLSMSAWMVHRLRIAWSTAGQHVRMARGLRRMPRTREALTAGDVSTTAASMLVSAREASPAEFARVEGTLLDAATTLAPRELRGALAYWRDAVDRRGAADEAEVRRERRRLHVSPALDGMVRVDGDLDPETGQVVMTALRAVLATSGRASDVRTAPSGVPMRLGRSATSGWTAADVRSSRASDRT